jgi:CRP/FNR family transcriptional regulator
MTEKSVSSHSANVSFKAGAAIFRPGDVCPGFFVVKSGTVRVSLAAANGREIVLYRVRPGEVCLQTFSCLVRGRAYGAEGVAETDLEAAIVDAKWFDQIMKDDDRFRAVVFEAVAHRFADFEQLVEDVALSGFDARLAHVLLRLAGDGGVVSATHERLAAETGSGRAVVSRQLEEFSRQGLVTLSRGRVRIDDQARLRRI